MKSQLKIKKFIPSTGATFGADRADRYGRELQRLLVVAGDDGLEPASIVDEAARSDSPLNDFFEWDNDVAAVRWRTHQARLLCNWISVEVVMPNGAEAVIPFMESVRVVVTDSDGNDSVERRYVSVRALERYSANRDSVEFDAVGRLLAAVETVEEMAALGGIHDPGLMRKINALKNHLLKMRAAA